MAVVCHGVDAGIHATWKVEVELVEFTRDGVLLSRTPWHIVFKVFDGNNGDFMYA